MAANISAPPNATASETSWASRRSTSGAVLALTMMAPTILWSAMTGSCTRTEALSICTCGSRSGNTRRQAPGAPRW